MTLNQEKKTFSKKKLLHFMIYRKVALKIDVRDKLIVFFICLAYATQNA